jgi:hypothetical protein
VSHVNEVQPIRVKMIRIAAIRVTCMSDLRHIHDPVLSFLKMEGIRLSFLICLLSRPVFWDAQSWYKIGAAYFNDLSALSFFS